MSGLSGDGSSAAAETEPRNKHDPLPASAVDKGSLTGKKKRAFSSDVWGFVERLTEAGQQLLKGTGGGVKCTHVCTVDIGSGQVCNEPLKLGKNKTMDKHGKPIFTTSVAFVHHSKNHQDSTVALKAAAEK